MTGDRMFTALHLGTKDFLNLSTEGLCLAVMLESLTILPLQKYHNQLSTIKSYKVAAPGLFRVRAERSAPARIRDRSQCTPSSFQISKK